MVKVVKHWHRLYPVHVSETSLLCCNYFVTINIDINIMIPTSWQWGKLDGMPSECISCHCRHMHWKCLRIGWLQCTTWCKICQQVQSFCADRSLLCADIELLADDTYAFVSYVHGTRWRLNLWCRQRGTLSHSHESDMVCFGRTTIICDVLHECSDQ